MRRFMAAPFPLVALNAIVVFGIATFIVCFVANSNIQTFQAASYPAKDSDATKENIELHQNTTFQDQPARIITQSVSYEGCELYEGLRPISCFRREESILPEKLCSLQAKHVHLAPASNASTGMTVSFSIDFSCGKHVEAYVLVGNDPTQLSRKYHSKPERIKQYNSTSCNAENPDDCRIKHETHCHSVHFGKYISDWIHHVELFDLQPETKYYYKIVPNTRKGGEVASFVTSPSWRNGYGMKLAVLGDPGQSSDASITFDGIQREEGINFVLMSGDLSYANRDHRKWDSWFDLFQPIFSDLPFVATPGNHDMDPDCCDWSIFKAYENRLAMPAVAPADLAPECLQISSFTNKPLKYGRYDFGNAFYSVALGVAHLIVLSTNSDSYEGSAQYNWLVKELESVDRQKTPWLLVMAHANPYESFRIYEFDDAHMTMKRDMEPLFVKYKVDIFFAGHDHAYSRTYPVAYDLPADNAPTYITIGNAGRGHHQKKAKHNQPWVVTWDDWSYGFGTITLVNRTHAHWQTRFHNESSTAYVENTDAMYITNTKFMSKKKKAKAVK